MVSPRVGWLRLRWDPEPGRSLHLRAKDFHEAIVTRTDEGDVPGTAAIPVTWDNLMPQQWRPLLAGYRGGEGYGRNLHDQRF